MTQDSVDRRSTKIQDTAGKRGRRRRKLLHGRRAPLAGAVLAGVLAAALAGVPVLGQETEPEQPEIVLPNVMLELEDLSVESVSGVLPREELTPPEFELPRYEQYAQVQEAELDIAVPLLETGDGDQARSSLIAEGVLGVGTRNHFLSSVSLYRFDEKPQGKLLFSHEVMDGFSGEPAGSGFSSREDDLTGSVRFGGERAGVELEGAFRDDEYGLQGQGQYYSRARRLSQGKGSFQLKSGDHLLLEAEASASAASRLLTQSGSSSSSRVTEYLVGTAAGATLSWDRFSVGLSPRYTYRAGGEDGAYDLHRFELTGTAGLQLGPSARADANAGWFYSEQGGHLFPFDLRLLFYPNDLFSISASLGYRVLEYDLWDVLNEYRFAGIPGELRDDHGWFLELGSHANLARSWVLSGGFTLMDHRDLLTPTDTQDPDTGLYPLVYDRMLQLAAQAGVRWNAVGNLSVFAGLESELLDLPRFFPRHQVTLEASWKNRAERAGGTLSAGFQAGDDQVTQVPVLNAEGFFRVTDSITASASLEDLLYPVLDQPRYSWHPFVTPGLRFTFKTHITF